MVTGSAGGSTGSCRDGSGRRALEALGSVVHLSVLGGVVRAPSAYWEVWSRARAMLGVVVPQPRALLEAVVQHWGGCRVLSPRGLGGSRGCQPRTDPSAVSGLPSPCPRGGTGPSAGRPWGNPTIPLSGEERGGLIPEQPRGAVPVGIRGQGWNWESLGLLGAGRGVGNGRGVGEGGGRESGSLGWGTDTDPRVSAQARLWQHGGDAGAAPGARTPPGGLHGCHGGPHAAGTELGTGVGMVTGRGSRAEQGGCGQLVSDAATPLCAVPAVSPFPVSLRGSSFASSTPACPGQGAQNRSGSRAPSTAGAWLMSPSAAAGARPCSASPSVRGDIPQPAGSPFLRDPLPGWGFLRESLPEWGFLRDPSLVGFKPTPCAWVDAAGRAGAEQGPVPAAAAAAPTAHVPPFPGGFSSPQAPAKSR